MKAIETNYKGYRFRSRLEARWAVFLDHTIDKWEYEPEGFRLDSGICYLPDFKLHYTPGRGYTRCTYGDEKRRIIDYCYLEIKGDISERDKKIAEEFSNNEPLFMLGNLPRKENFWEMSSEIGTEWWKNPDYLFSFSLLDNDQYCAIPVITKTGHFELFGYDYLDDEIIDQEFTMTAYKNAREARFEHGEKPTISKKKFEIEDDKPCPYCGGTDLFAVHEYEDDGVTRYYQIGCPNCNRYYSDDTGDCYRKWNHRTWDGWFAEEEPT